MKHYNQSPSRSQINLLLQLLDEKKAYDIVQYEDHKTDVIVATALSKLHLKALARYCKIHASQNGLILNYQRQQPYDLDWICMSINGVIVHLMLETARKYFNLENKILEDA